MLQHWDMSEPAKLDPEEEHFRIASSVHGLRLFLRYLPARPRPEAINVVLYVHGGTFASALSIAHRLDGHSWRDALCASGFHVWGLDSTAWRSFRGADARRTVCLPEPCAPRKWPITL